MVVTYKGKTFSIKCDDGMPLYAQDGTDIECCNTIVTCKQCILKHVGEVNNGGWDTKSNEDMDMCINIAGERFTI
jgi:hypothetical protein